ncbi:hypothetical protein KKA53_02150 [Candidatus Dependentiae bacterium]|nr:hypothetical protein [Candidatus Dependentiae bacterium]
MKRNRAGDGSYGFREHKKRKIDKGKRPSVFDQYLGKDGLYRCPDHDCKHECETRSAITKHLWRERHGHYVGRGRGTIYSVYEQFLGEDGTYYCPHCDVAGKTKKAIQHHFSRKRHGHLKDVYRRKKTTIYDRYWCEEKGAYCCPGADCGHENKSLVNFKHHIKRNGHDVYNPNKRKYDCYKSNGFFRCPVCTYKSKSPRGIGEHFSVAKSHRFSKEDYPESTESSSEEDLDDQLVLEQSYKEEGDGLEENIVSVLVPAVSFFRDKVSREIVKETGFFGLDLSYWEDALFVSGLQDLDLMCLEDGCCKKFKVWVDIDHWVGVELFFQPGSMQVRIIDPLYRGSGDFEKLLNIAERIL